MNAALGRLQGLVTNAQEKTQKEIAEAGTSAQVVRQRVLALEKTVAFLKAEASLNILDDVVAGTQLSEALTSLGAVDTQLSTLDAVLQAAERVSECEARARIETVVPLLGEWFGRLSQHDSLRAAGISVTTTHKGGSKNSYSICATGNDGWQASAAPALSGGYQTILAVATLCALSEDEGSHTRLGLLALDEPTVSLDGELTAQMGVALGAHVGTPKLLLTTTDKSFAEAVTKGAGASRVRVIQLSRWTAAQGSHVVGEP